MDNNDQLFKRSIARQHLSFLCSSLPLGRRLPSIKDTAQNLGVSVGILQKALYQLEEEEAVVLEKKGCQGTVLVHRSPEKLYEINRSSPIFYALPLPYTLRYEDLALQLENLFKGLAPCYAMHARGAVQRLKMTEEGRADFCIVSRFAFEHTSGKNLTILHNFGGGSYLEKHVLVSRPNEKIPPNPKIGVDMQSLDQLYLAEKIFTSKNFVPTNYHSLIDKLMCGEIDATVLNWDEDRVKALGVKEIPSAFYPESLTEAVAVAQTEKIKARQLAYFFNKQEAL